MKILALEFSSEQRSVALLDAPNGEAPRLLASAVETQGRHVRALTLIGAVLAQAGLEPKQVDCVAVGLGPGSYNGIRGAISTAQGWQLALPVKLLGISSIECIARQLQAEGLRGSVTVLVDAQRSEFYLAEYEILASEARSVQPLRLASMPEVRERLQQGQTCAGPELARYFPGARTVFPEARMLAQLAVERADFVTGDKLVPIYLRETAFVKAPPPKIFE